LLGLGAGLLRLPDEARLVHFAEFGVVDEDAEADVALVEGSISTLAEAERIARVRAHSRFLVAMGACATSGGIQALRNLGDAPQWAGDVYPDPAVLGLAPQVSPLAAHVRVDAELWGCPVTSRQVLSAIRLLGRGVLPVQDRTTVCQACKRRGVVCVLVARGLPCMGPVTRTGCDAVCPAYGRDCYGCTGPAENAAPEALARRLVDLGMPPRRVAQRFVALHSRSAAFRRGAAAADRSRVDASATPEEEVAGG
jgi:coenzyme F420-reducing hydrogenase gamma subunit